VASSQTIGRLCRLKFLLALAGLVTVGSESLGTHDHILMSQIRDSPNLEGQVPVFIPRRKVSQLCLKALGSLLVASYVSQGDGGGIRTRLHTDNICQYNYSYKTPETRPCQWDITRKMCNKIYDKLCADLKLR
jgi:hypothetical protein